MTREVKTTLRILAGAFLAGALFWIIVLAPWGKGITMCMAWDPEIVEEDRFEKIVLVENLHDPLQVKALPDGRLIIIQRDGRIKLYKPQSRCTVDLGKLEVSLLGEVGLDGVAPAPDFDRAGWLYLFYAPARNKDVLRISRFTVTNEKLDLASEKVLIEYHIEKANAAHMGGGMVMLPDGTLYIGTGDNSPPIPELPCDQRPGRENFDSFRSAANSNDLRGKVLRIHPRPDGGYDCPAGNLFPGGKGGRPEIFAMGCRNAYRLTADPKTGWVAWGDVGPNLAPEMGIPCGGYDEVNLTRTAGNFGWPMFVGPNEAFRFYDFEKKKPGRKFDVNNPINPSKNNTGAKRLPLPRPALIWYSTVASKAFPALGAGARCIMGGPFYHYDPNLKSDLKLPEALDGRLFIYEWCRNWIKTVGIDNQGHLKDIQPFAREMMFRKPIDLEFAPDGTLLVLEYGDKWYENFDAQLVKIVYRRGNRAPVAVASASPLAGKQPLTVRFDGSKSFDKDHDPLQYSWTFGTTDVQAGPRASHTFTKPGTYTAKLTVTDSHGAASTASVRVMVGNSRPVVQLLEPIAGGFFDWEDTIPYRVGVKDEEDGTNIDPKRVVVRAEYRPRRESADGGPAGSATEDAGLGLMRRSDCFGCHSSQQPGGGPPYTEIAKKYRGIGSARERLAQKVITGGAGTWGVPAMPPHPQHTLDQTKLMVDWVLSLDDEGAQPPQVGTHGVLQALKKPQHRGDAGVYVFTASYTDNGAPGAGPLTGEATVVLHARRMKPAFYDVRHNIELVDILEENTIAARFDHGSFVGFRDVNLAGVPRAVFRLAPFSPVGGVLEVHADGPAGPLVGTVPVPPGTDSLAFRQVTAELRDPGGVHDLYLLAKRSDGAGPVVNLNWIEFAAPRRPRVALPTLPIAPAATARKFVREWTFADLEAGLPELGHGRSFATGKQLFTVATCASCHKMGTQGGDLGPDLSNLSRKMAERGGRAWLLRSVVEPSAEIDEQYRTRIIITTSGRTLTGIVKSRDAKSVRIAANAAEPNQVTEVPVADIEEEKESKVSMMPPGLLVTLTREQILDLLAYVEAGGDPNGASFKK